VLLLAGLLACAATACADLGGPAKLGVRGQLAIGPGVVLVEKGQIYQGSFQYGATIGPHGDFEVVVDAEGTYGFHAYVEPRYLYIPIEVQIEGGAERTLIAGRLPIDQSMVDWEGMCERNGRCEWVDQSSNPFILTPGLDDDLSNNPVISNPEVRLIAPGTYQVTVDVEDPDGNLSNQILAHPVGTGIGAQLNATGYIIEGNYPNGRYTATVIADDAEPGSLWLIVAADHECSNSQILEVYSTFE